MPFSKLQIHDILLKTLDRLGYDTPTPVQNKVIPKILRGFDLRVSAPTGTGKTAAFLLPILTRLLSSSPMNGKGPRVLILVPTRELALQVSSQVEKYSQSLRHMKTVCIYGGVAYPKQTRDLMRAHDIIVATPGRFIDHLEKGRISLKRLEVFVLDEADRMLDMGFSQPVRQIAKATPKKRQTLLFSATLKGNVLEFSNELLKKPLEINIQAQVDKKTNIDQHLHYVDDIHHKHKILDHLLQDATMNQAIIFTSTKRLADKLCSNLQKKGAYSVAALHGDMNQRQRTKTIMQLRKGKLRVLVATDVAARGIDVKTISHVINFDLPSTMEDYVHRIGRTGRAGATGVAASFAMHSERSTIISIEKFLGKKMTCHVIPGLEPTGQSKDSSSKKRHPSWRKQRKFSSKKRR